MWRLVANVLRKLQFLIHKTQNVRPTRYTLIRNGVEGTLVKIARDFMYHNVDLLINMLYSYVKV